MLRELQTDPNVNHCSIMFLFTYIIKNLEKNQFKPWTWSSKLRVTLATRISISAKSAKFGSDFYWTRIWLGYQKYQISTLHCIAWHVNRGKSCSRHSKNNRMWWTGFRPVILKKLVSLSLFHCKPLCKSLQFWCSNGAAVYWHFACCKVILWWLSRNYWHYFLFFYLDFHSISICLYES